MISATPLIWILYKWITSLTLQTFCYTSTIPCPKSCLSRVFTVSSLITTTSPSFFSVLSLPTFKGQSSQLQLVSALFASTCCLWKTLLFPSSRTCYTSLINRLVYTSTTITFAITKPISTFIIPFALSSFWPSSSASKGSFCLPQYHHPLSKHFYRVSFSIFQLFSMKNWFFKGRLSRNLPH